MNDSSKLIGENGGKFYDSTATLNGNWFGIEMNEDTVLNVLTETGAVDATVLGEWNTTGKTFSQGVIITPNRDHFTSISIVTGSVILRND